MKTGAGRSGRDIGAVFAALSDPTRRTILDHPANNDAATAPEIAAGVPVTRQAVGKPLQTRGRAGVVQPVPDGREHAGGTWAPDGCRQTRRGPARTRRISGGGH